jgi:L-iditol 2-dehydrogenase
VDIPEPEPGPGEVRLQVLQCGICGSDLHAYRAQREFPVNVGHEMCGVVETLGEGLATPAEGNRVCVEPFTYCGECRYCRQGDNSTCDAAQYLFSEPAGALAEKAVVPAEAVYAVPDGLSDVEAMMVEPVAVAVRAVRRARVTEHCHVGVIGAGTMGLLCMELAIAQGASVRLAVDRFSHLTAAARELGAERTILVGEEYPIAAATELTGGRGLDIVFDAAASGTSFSTALSVVRKKGRVLLLGVAAEPLLVPLRQVTQREIEVVGSFCYGVVDGKPDFVRAIEWLESGKLDVARLVSHVLPLSRVDEAFRMADEKADGAIKVAVRTDG